jgi:hypothetical protein
VTDDERKKARRASAGALLLAGDRATRTMMAAADTAIAGASHELRQHRQTDAKRVAALLVLLAASKRMSSALADAILTGRKEARTLAAGRLGAELRLVGVSSETGSPALLAASHGARMQADVAEATIAAESLAGQWRGLASRAVLVAQRKGEDVAAAVSGTRVPLKSRVERTAESEATRAYNDEHAERARDLVAQGDLDPSAVLREWSAEIDACEHCWPMDGERVKIDESFPGGYEPGEVHPRCRCSDIIVSAA